MLIYIFIYIYIYIHVNISYSSLEGTTLADTSIVFKSGSGLTGRALAGIYV
jgi:hypothetical protein